MAVPSDSAPNAFNTCCAVTAWGTVSKRSSLNRFAVRFALIGAQEYRSVGKAIIVFAGVAKWQTHRT